MQAECKEIGERIKQARERAGLTQGKLAQRIGIARISVYRYETGDREVPLGVLMLISKALGVSVEYLVGGESMVREGREMANLLRTNPNIRAMVELMARMGPEEQMEAVRGVGNCRFKLWTMLLRELDQ